MVSSDPRFEVRAVDRQAERRRRWWLLTAMVAIAGLAYAVGYYGSRPVPSVTTTSAEPAIDLTGDNRELRARQAVLERRAQVAEEAAQQLRHEVMVLDGEVQAARSELDFYRRVVGAGAASRALEIYDVQLQATSTARRYRVQITLTGKPVGDTNAQGRLEVRLLGQADGEASTVSVTPTDGLDYRFRFFQRLQTFVNLPTAMVPSRLEIVAVPDRGRSLRREFAWSDLVADP